MTGQDKISAAPVGTSSSSGCPVNHEEASVWTRWSSAKPPIGPQPASSLAKACGSEVANQDVNLPAVKERGPSSADSLEEAAMYPQAPHIDQVFPLNLSRQVSSIPRGSSRDGDATVQETDAGLATQSKAAAISNDNLPHHQAGTTDDDRNRWVYPSEQQLYNAMRKKGWANVPEASIPVVLQIHNAVNEKTWSRVLEYHRFCPREPRLVRFQGRPNDATPKAWFVANVLGYPPPFDRHDWYVEYYKPSPFPGGAGRWIEQRYVIDFYESGRREQSSAAAAAAASSPARVDARPALDSPRAAWLRAKHALQMALPGITHYWYKRGGGGGGGGANGIEQEPR